MEIAKIKTVTTWKDGSEKILRIYIANVASDGQWESEGSLAKDH